MKNFIKIFFSLVCIALVANLAPAQDPDKDKKPPRGNLMIVNATSVPEITLKANGKEMYNDFRKGEKTTDLIFDRMDLTLEVSDNLSKSVYSELVKIIPDTFQSLVIMGDFRDIEKGETGLKGVNDAATPYKNVAFLLLNHSFGPNEKEYRYRIVNAVGDKSITCKVKGTEDAIIAPGHYSSYSDQLLQIKFDISEGGLTLPIDLRQAKPYHNVTFVIYEVNGSLAFIVIPEETPKTYLERFE